MQSQTKQNARNALTGALMVLAAAITVSSKAIMVKLAYAQVAPFPVDASTLIALRMAFSAPFFIALAFYVRASVVTPKITSLDAGMIAVLGVFGGYAPMLLDFEGLAYVTAGLERIILYIYPTIVVVMSALLFKHRIGKRAYFAILATYAGVALVVGHDVFVFKTGSTETMLGAGLVAASAIAYAAYLIVSGWMIPRVGALAFTAYTMLVTSVASAAQYASTTHQVTIFNLPAPVYWLSLLMAIVATVLPAILLNVGIHKIGSSKAALISSVGPVSTIFFAYVFLGEQITWLQIAGTLLVLVGVLVISLAKK
jgi:drug/metabolite transporter (DMT)-like permease